MINNENYKDFLELKNSDIYNLAFNALKFYSVAFERIDLDNIIEEPTINLSSKEKENILNGFFNTINPIFKDKYNELISKNKIIVVDIIDNDPNIFGRLYDYSLPSEEKDQTIKITPQENDYLFLSTIIHEIVHAVEWDNIKKHYINNDYEYCNYVNNSLYIEVLPVYFESKFCDYLDNINIDKDIVKHLKMQIIYNTEGNILKRINDIEITKNKIALEDDDEIYDNDNLHNLIMNNYASILQIYFNNIEDNYEKNNIINKYNEIKYYTKGIDIFNKLDCTPKKLYKSIKRQVLKCK